MDKTAEALVTTENQSTPRAEAGVPSLQDALRPEEHDRTAWQEFLEDGPALLKKNFEGFDASAKGDKSFIDAHFSTKDYNSSSPLLRKYVSEGHVPHDATLQQRVQALTGRR